MPSPLPPHNTRLLPPPPPPPAIPRAQIPSPPARSDADLARQLNSHRREFARKEFWTEAATIDRLRYKNHSQHRGSMHFGKIMEVRRLLGRLRELALEGVMDGILDVMHPNRNKRTQGRWEFLPARPAMNHALVRLVGGRLLVDKVRSKKLTSRRMAVEMEECYSLIWDWALGLPDIESERADYAAGLRSSIKDLLIHEGAIVELAIPAQTLDHVEESDTDDEERPARRHVSDSSFELDATISSISDSFWSVAASEANAEVDGPIPDFAPEPEPAPAAPSEPDQLVSAPEPVVAALDRKRAPNERSTAPSKKKQKRAPSAPPPPAHDAIDTIFGGSVSPPAPPPEPVLVPEVRLPDPTRARAVEPRPTPSLKKMPAKLVAADSTSSVPKLGSSVMGKTSRTSSALMTSRKVALNSKPSKLPIPSSKASAPSTLPKSWSLTPSTPPPPEQRPMAAKGIKRKIEATASSSKIGVGPRKLKAKKVAVASTGEIDDIFGGL
ncbi:hypothetical protein BDK51DRAFT_26637 [Blyttiomyces helicus]|uniref:Nucleolus and neural progenitor protein-like N-terminal domain-containing protein n=1 Tax=Blyttiomyces helicus TaxID=388810 RepID=A0A4P9WCF5_9FUNG|nr:hypothetical protein BDK51DRAFT_26637 [Blyttiomyces helicus]|eukprot:RKO89283.1 hypothetical protein BDK51DRAFT_26637 [Blyttiomyces helicus]